MRTRRSTLVAAAAGAALALGVGGMAIAAGSGALADSSATPPVGQGGGYGAGVPGGPGRVGGHAGLGDRIGHRGAVLHGELVIKDPTGTGTRTITVQRGEVTKISDTSVTVRSSDEFTVAWALTGGTRGDRSRIAVGDTVDVRGTKTGDGTATAEAIREEGVRPAAGQGGQGGQDGRGAGRGRHGGGMPGWRQGVSPAPTVSPSATT